MLCADGSSGSTEKNAARGGLEVDRDARGMERVGGSKIHIPRRMRKRNVRYRYVSRLNRFDEIGVFATTATKSLKTQPEVRHNAAFTSAPAVDIRDVSAAGGTVRGVGSHTYGFVD